MVASNYGRKGSDCSIGRFEQKSRADPRWIERASTLFFVMLLSACGANSSAPSDQPNPSAPHATIADLQFCVDDLNGFRARNRLPPLTRNAEIEQYAADGARLDHEAGVAHQHITRTPSPVARAENEFLRQPIGFFGNTVQKTMNGFDDLSYSEGIFGGHYQNMINSSFTQMGCGVFRDSSGSITITQDFR